MKRRIGSLTGQLTGFGQLVSLFPKKSNYLGTRFWNKLGGIIDGTTPEFNCPKFATSFSGILKWVAARRVEMVAGAMSESEQGTPRTSRSDGENHCADNVDADIISELRLVALYQLGGTTVSQLSRRKLFDRTASRYWPTRKRTVGYNVQTPSAWEEALSYILNGTGVGWERKNVSELSRRMGLCRVNVLGDRWERVSPDHC